MTYKTRQEVLRAAADWMDVCEKAGVDANCKWNGELGYLKNRGLHDKPELYEFPLALLEGKEVWVGSELYDQFGRAVVAQEYDGNSIKADNRWYSLGTYSWNPPKPNTVMVEMLVRDAEFIASTELVSFNTRSSCKKALEKL